MAKAAEIGIDLAKTRRGVKDFVERISLLSNEEIAALTEGFSRSKAFGHAFRDANIRDFLRLRSYSVNHFVGDYSQLVNESGRELGLDVFPPCLG